MSAMAGARLVGQSVHRVEDARVLTGRGRYVDDLRLPNMLHAVFVRSPLPHARITRLDVDSARALPGVVAVITGAELAAATEPMRQMLPLPGQPEPAFHSLSVDRVRHVGDPFAIVVAESRYAAEDARDAIEVDFETLPAIASAAQALADGAQLVFDDLESNLLQADLQEFGDVDGAFAQADRVVRLTIRSPRITHVPMETRGGVADYDPGTGELVFHSGTQSPHADRLGVARALGHPAERLRVIAPDVGGSFGQKGFAHREDVGLCFAAKHVGRPVKWIEDRGENLAVAGHAREEEMEVAVAVRADGTILGFDVSFTLDQGAYLFALPSAFFAAGARTVLPSAYRIDALRWRQSIVITNKATASAYRGPWASESLIREVAIDRIAHELGLDPVEVRRRNLVPLDEQPRKLATGPTLEGATSAVSLERAVERIGYAERRDEQRRAREQGRLLGIGFCTYVEPAPGPPDMGAARGMPPATERAVAKLEPDGHLTVYTGQSPHGQGHETTLAQVAADEFGVPFEHVRIVHGDTAQGTFHLMGTGGSRAATMGSGSALMAARSVKEKALKLAGEMMEIAPDDLEIVEGVVRGKGSPATALPLAAVAAASYFGRTPPGEEPGLRSEAIFTQPRGGWSGGTHVCVVEIDPETGLVTILRYLVVEDCGRVINPAIVDGQIRGGVAQGIGLALLEQALYDEDANFLAGTFMDYLVPTAMEIPRIEIEHLESVPLGDEVDFRGVGEGGTIAAPPAVVNAVSDALDGVPVTELPLTPSRVLELVDQMDKSV